MSNNYFLELKDELDRVSSLEEAESVFKKINEQYSNMSQAKLDWSIDGNEWSRLYDEANKKLDEYA